MLPSTAPAGVRAGGFWSVPREWEGETAFLVCGGPSVASVDTDRLRGRRVMVVNSSCARLPWADILFFGDERWARVNRAAIAAFKGRVVSALDDANQSRLPGVTYLRKRKDIGGLSDDPSEVRFRATSASGAINLLCHLEVAAIIVLGLDGGPDAQGNVYHHTPHQWGIIAGSWERQRAELGQLVAPLVARGVTLLNASPISRIPFWPKVDLKDVL